MSRHTSGGDDDAKSVFLGILCKSAGFCWSAVGGHNVDFGLYAVFFQAIDSLFDNIPIAVASHNDCNFFQHFYSPFLIKNKKAAKSSQPAYHAS